MTADKKIIKELKQFLFEEYGLNLADKEAFECYESLYYIAKSIIAYNKVNKEDS